MRCATFIVLTSFFALDTASAGPAASVVDGTLTVQGSAPTFVGRSTSDLNKVISTFFPQVTVDHPVTKRATVYNSSKLSYLTLTGQYAVDEPLLLRPQLVLVLAGATLRISSGFSGLAMVHASGAKYSAVVSQGGPGAALISCKLSAEEEAAGLTAPSPIGIYAVNSDWFLVEGVTISGCGLSHTTAGAGEDVTAGIYFRGVNSIMTAGRVSNCVITGCSRAFWALAATRSYIHGTLIVNNSVHTVDFDAFSSFSVAYNNTVSGSTQEAVFIEQGSDHIVSYANTLGPGNAAGVGLFNFAFGKPLANTVVLSNTITGNGRGIYVGSSSLELAYNSTIAGNTLDGNTGAAMMSNGRQVASWYAANKVAGKPALPSALGSSTSANLTALGPFVGSPLRRASIADGILSFGAVRRTVGRTTSALNAVLATLFGPPVPIIASLVDASKRSYLSLDGDYEADVPLLLPPQVVVVLNGTIAAASGFAGEAVVMAKDAAYAAVVSAGPGAGRILCSAAGRSPRGVYGLNADGFLVDGLTVDGCGLDGMTGGIVLQGGQRGEVANCVVRSGSSGILLLQASRPYVHENAVSGNRGSGIVLGNGVADGILDANTVAGNAGDGIAVGVANKYALLAGNRVSRNSGVGISFYAGGPETVLPLAGAHTAIANLVASNARGGIVVALTNTTSRTGNSYIYDLMLFSNQACANGGVGDMSANGGAWPTGYSSSTGRAPEGQVVEAVQTLASAKGGALFVYDPLDRLSFQTKGPLLTGSVCDNTVPALLEGRASTRRFRSARVTSRGVALLSG